MCVIIHKPKGTAIDEADIRAAHRTNGHGFGYMAWDPVSKKIWTRKGINWPIDDIIKTIVALKDYEAVFHFRIKTHGPIIDQLCHPFKVLDKKKHGTDMFMMHNGQILKVKIADEKKDSDTSTFVRTMLRPVLRHKPKILREGPFKAFLAEYIGMSKLVFMYGNGEVVKIRPEAGDEHKGCWWSNLNGIRTYGQPVLSTQAEQWRDNQKKAHAAATPQTMTTPSPTSTVIGKPQDTTKLFGFPIANGDEVYVYNKEDETFLDIGIISTVSFGSFNVTFKPLKKDADKHPHKSPDGSVTVWANVKDGRIVYLHMTDYMCIPGEYKSEAIPDDKPVGVPANNVVPLIPADTAKKVLALIEENEQESCSSCVTTPNDKPALLKIECDGVEYFPHSRVGGIGLLDSGEEYASRSIMDFNDMTPNERVGFFTTNYAEAFNMLQDLAEFFVQQEIVLEGEESRATSTRAIETKHKFEEVAKSSTKGNVH